jgi:hypothetical protein
MEELIKSRESIYEEGFLKKIE